MVDWLELPFSTINVYRNLCLFFQYFSGKNVENLLQRMFENELDVEDIGPADIQNLEDDQTSPISLKSL